MSIGAANLPDVARATVRAGVPRLDYSEFHAGQRAAYWSTARITLVLAGTQGGKTITGPPWLLRQIREHGPGDYIVGAPTFALMEKKVLPEFLRLFRDALRLGDYSTSPVRRFVFSPEGSRRLFGSITGPTTHVFFGYGEDPESLESMTAKAAWLDEPGQKKFKRESYEAIMRRLSIEQGPLLLTTTPYQLGWLSDLVQRADELGVKVINFPSIANPRFSRAEWERARTELPAWKFDMFYRGIFTRPAGLIYDAFDEARHVVPRFALPPDWPRYLGLDFGGVNTAGVFYAAEVNADGQETGRLFAYREYLAGSRSAAEHAAELRTGEPHLPFCVGGSKSEGQWRREFRAAGLPVREPDQPDVEVGIARVYGAHKRGEILVFDDLHRYLEQKRTYSRPVGPDGEPTEGIEDKAKFHLMDAERYVVGFVKRGKRGARDF